MGNRQKVPVTIVRGIVDSDGYLHRKDGCFIQLGGDLTGQEVEIVKHVEPKLIRPEGVRWVPVKTSVSDLNRNSFLQLNDAVGTIIARVYSITNESHCWEAGDGDCCAKTLKLARIAVEKALADAGLNDFDWEVPDA